jgi:putative toxin-antitoxin system antitoxin component (TIGR02293 family)
MALNIVPRGTALSEPVRMSTIQELTTFMGGPRFVGSPRSDYEFILAIRKGLPADVIAHVAVSSSLTEDEILRALRIPKRTAARRKATASPLKPLASELIYRLSRVVVEATDVLGSRAKAREWILAKNRALHGERPIDLLDTAIGFEDVLDVLRRIDHGVYS